MAYRSITSAAARTCETYCDENRRT